jgi:hypothetical protein
MAGNPSKGRAGCRSAGPPPRDRRRRCFAVYTRRSTRVDGKELKKAQLSKICLLLGVFLYPFHPGKFASLD